MEVVDDDGIAGEQSAVGIQCGGLFIEIPGADIRIAGQFLILFVTAQDEGDFGMYFQFGYTIYNIDTRCFHHFGGGKVVLFIEAGFQFHEDRDFLSILGGSYQGIDNGGVFRHPVLGYHDFAYGRFVHRLVQKVDEVLERVVRVM